METILDLRSIEPRFRTALIFSLFEGLMQGKAFKLISDVDPNELTRQFSEVKVKNVKMKADKIDSGTWEMKISKTDPHASGGCCGMCGGEGS